jgi:hypothetical protein
VQRTTTWRASDKIIAGQVWCGGRGGRATLLCGCSSEYRRQVLVFATKLYERERERERAAPAVCVFVAHGNTLEHILGRDCAAAPTNEPPDRQPV